MPIIIELLISILVASTITPALFIGLRKTY